MLPLHSRSRTHRHFQNCIVLLARLKSRHYKESFENHESDAEAFCYDVYVTLGESPYVGDNSTHM